MKTVRKLIVVIFTFLTLAVSAHAADDSPLFEAVKMGDIAAVEALLAKGADVNAKDKYGGTPLHVASKKGKKDIAELLLAKGADVNAKSKYGDSPLHKVAGAYDPYHTHKDVVTLLLANGADVNAKNVDGTTPLHQAASGDIAELLLGKGAEVNAKSMAGTTPLHRAATGSSKDVVELLLAKGADINAKDKYGDTPLNAAEKEAARLVAGQQVYKDDTFMYASLAPSIRNRKDVVELLENHILKQANPRAVFAQLTEKLKSKPDDSTRRLILKLASELKPVPAIPEEARKHFVEGTAIVKAAKNPAQQALAAQSFTEALKVAPWWGDAYYNLGVAQELAEQYDEAEKALTFYLLSNPGEQEKRDAQDRIYALSAKRKLLGAK